MIFQHHRHILPGGRIVKFHKNIKSFFQLRLDHWRFFCRKIAGKQKNILGLKHFLLGICTFFGHLGCILQKLQICSNAAQTTYFLRQRGNRFFFFF